jgi:hypothetical protein
MIWTEDTADGMIIAAVEMPILSTISLYGGHVLTLEHMRE